MKSIIVAYDQNRGIGRNGELPWGSDLPADMRHFRQTTTGSAVIMGRKTFESIGRALPNRQNIVLSRHALQESNIGVASTMEEAFSQVATPTAYVIGGGEIYTQSLPFVDNIIATEVHASFEGIDSKFPELDENWVEAERNNFERDDKNKFDYSFVTYIRR